VRITENLFHEFKKLGVRVLIADMPQYNGERKDILIRQIMEAISEENRKEIIERLWKGRQERVRKGLFPGGNIPYGYERNGKRVLINQREAEIIRTVFVLAHQGMSEQGIADQLNCQGCRLRNGKPWTQRQVCRILHRESLYREGVIRYGEVTGFNRGILIIE
jgi:site-specific DNA recombinase